MHIQLTSSEIMQGALVGVMRQVQNLKVGRKDAYGAEQEQGWQYHLEGALGEMAVAKALGIYWNGNLSDLDASDMFAGRIEVRTTSHPRGRLIMHDKDKDDHVYILAIGVNGSYRIQGCITGRDGKKPEYWVKGKRPAYFVPWEALSPVKTVIGL